MAKAKYYNTAEAEFRNSLCGLVRVPKLCFDRLTKLTILIILTLLNLLTKLTKTEGNMSASDIQQQRMRDYFRNSAKEILRGEGLKAVSARNIADRAGYSYATLYNYFDDLSALIFECVRDFQSEINEVASLQIDAAATGDAKLKAGVTAWVNYFVQYPGIFELFFLERMGSVGNRSEIADLIYNSIEPACRPGIEKLVEEKNKTAEQAENLMDAIRFETTGLMLYYSNRKNPADYTGLIEKLNSRLADLTN